MEVAIVGNVTRLSPQPLENVDRRLDGNLTRHRHGGSEVHSVWSVVAVVEQASKQHCVVSRTRVAPFESSLIFVAAFAFGDGCCLRLLAERLVCV